MKRSEWVRRGAVVGLALTLLGLTALSLAGAAGTRRSAETVTRSTSLAKAYDRAHHAVTDEESLERKYRLEPGPEVRTRHRQAAADMLVALADIDSRGHAEDQRLVSTLRTLHADYLAALERLFAAVDAGDDATVLRIDSGEVDPTFDHMSELVDQAADEHAAAAARALTRLRDVEQLVFATTIAGFGVGLGLLLVFAAVVTGFQRTLVRHARDSEHQALHDPLTGLPNRALFVDRLDQALLAARRDGGDVAVALLDLDRFKQVNDTLGHRTGDELLRQVAARTADGLRSSDTLARLSGDEFAILLPGADTVEATALAGRLLSRLHRSFLIDDVTVDVEASIGIAAAPRDAGNSEALMRCADAAMHAAKAAKTGVAPYRPDMQAADAGHLALLGDLRRALEASDQLAVHYQPKVSLQYGQLQGVEALIRWAHPTRGMVSPADFIPIAETTGLINRLTAYVLRHSIGQARAWLDDGLTVAVAVNLSPRCLLDPTLVGQITDLLREYQLPAGLLRLEVTETAVMANPGLAMKTLTELYELGIRLSIDDFGTGYSSMAYLKRLPVDELKIDRTFVLNLHTDHDDAALVRGAIDLGHNLGLTVVAEGVESAAHVTALQQFGCDIAQGYHYARPMPLLEVTRWLHDHQVADASTAA